MKEFQPEIAESVRTGAFLVGVQKSLASPRTFVDSECFVWPIFIHQFSCSCLANKWLKLPQKSHPMSGDVNSLY